MLNQGPKMIQGVRDYFWRLLLTVISNLYSDSKASSFPVLLITCLTFFCWSKPKLPMPSTDRKGLKLSKVWLCYICTPTNSLFTDRFCIRGTGSINERVSPVQCPTDHTLGSIRPPVTGSSTGQLVQGRCYFSSTIIWANVVKMIPLKSIWIFSFLTCERSEPNMLWHVHSNDHILIGFVLMEVSDSNEHVIWFTPVESHLMGIMQHILHLVWNKERIVKNHKKEKP